MGWLIGLGILVLLALIPISLRGEYDQRGAFAWLQIGPFRYDLYPVVKSKTKKSNKSPKRTTQKATKQSSRGGNLDSFLSVSSLILDVIKDLRKKLRVDLLELKILLADGDPADLAVKYGKTCGAVATLLNFLESVLVIKEQDVDVSCDFTASAMVVSSKLYISITLGRLALLALTHGVKFVKKQPKTSNQRKGGAKA